MDDVSSIKPMKSFGASLESGVRMSLSGLLSLSANLTRKMLMRTSSTREPSGPWMDE